MFNQPKVYSFAEWAYNELSYSYHEDGAVESAARTANNTAKSIGRLLDYLIKSKELPAEEAEYIVTGFRRNKEKK